MGRRSPLVVVTCIDSAASEIAGRVFIQNFIVGESPSSVLHHKPPHLQQRQRRRRKGHCGGRRSIMARVEAAAAALFGPSTCFLWGDGGLPIFSLLGITFLLHLLQLCPAIGLHHDNNR
ncbi:hypothetical protein E2C01_059826 [Portunus trituberculatus]|uniref:Uncharacterized protein n=1 Tax=Portunus trituberculatus TaxID=210409 RepID=A0A5B7H7A0_PORTR|nr:hypothetical protein [Portunus trituberculatus]